MTNDEKLYGIVTRYANYKDYHRMLTIFTPKYGFISVLAPASRRPKSSLRAASEMFVFGYFSVKVKGDKKTLSEVEIVDAFYDLRCDLTALSCAIYMRDFCEFVSLKDEESAAMFSLFIRCLSLLCHQKISPEIIRYAFEMNAMEINGFKVQLKSCVNCSKDVKETYFNINEGGVICENCATLNITTIKVAPRAINTLKIIDEMPFDKLSVIKLNADIVKEIEEFWTKYIRWHLDRKFQSAAFMDKSRDF